MAETAPWVVLGPLNMIKVALINKGSPVANYIVVPPAETCQAACDIARMWAVLFWGLQTVVSFSILRNDFSSAALAKTVVGSTLIAAYLQNVVRLPVFIAGIFELLAALAMIPHEYFSALRRIVRRYALVGFAVHWITYGLTFAGFYIALGRGVDLPSHLRSFHLNSVADTLSNIDSSTGVARVSLAWSCAFATAPLRLVTDLLFTLLIATLLSLLFPSSPPLSEKDDDDKSIKTD